MPVSPTKELTLLEDKTFVLTLTVPQNEVQKYYQQTTSRLAADLEIPGFRKGKAPIDLALKHLSSDRLISETLNELVTDLYHAKIHTHDLKPIVPPQIKLLNPPLTPDKEWQIEITSCQMPQIKLADYRSQISKTNKANAKAEDRQAKIDQILKIITDSSELKLPPILLKAEMENRLSQLVDQTTQAGLTVSQYLQSKNTTLEKYQQSLQGQLTREWTLNLALDQIATNEKVEIKPEEIDEAAKKYPDQKVDRPLLTYLLRQQKTIDLLLSL